MRTRIVWLALCCLMVTGLVLVSCAPTATPTPTSTPTPSPSLSPTPTPGAEMVRDSLGRLVEKPQYGGVFSHILPATIRYFDDVMGNASHAKTLMHTNDDLLMGDWTKGPAGTGEASWGYHMFPSANTIAGCLAESWEVKPDAETVVFHVRKGVHFALNPNSQASRLVSGREMTADDVVFSIKRLFTTSTCGNCQEYPWDTHIESLTAPDKYTVVLKCKPGKLGAVFEYATMRTKIVPHEVVEQYKDLNKWENSCGTGPFIMDDYVAMSVATLKKNPNYWDKDPFHPQNQLPYIDGIKLVIIPDTSTIMAAIRTAKVDHAGASIDPTPIVWEDVQALLKTNPELKWGSYMSASPTCINCRVDLPAAPWYDKRVRQALSMAIDRQAIKNDFYSGEALVLGWPVMPIPEFKDVYIPLEQLPQSVQEIFSFNPDKAKKLLAEAGYPKGFKCEVICEQPKVDLLSVIKNYWGKVGVDLVIDVKDYTIFKSMTVGGTFKEMCIDSARSDVWRFLDLKPAAARNRSNVNDAVINKAYEAVTVAYWDEPKRRQLFKDLIPYILEQAYLLEIPTPYNYQVWQPWIKVYTGERTVGYTSHQESYFAKYIWINQELKQKLTGQR